jgi:hypothetical protein
VDMVMTEEGSAAPAEYVTYQDGEYWLLAHQATKIISENSGKRIDVKYLHHFVMQGRLHPRKITSRMNWYPYSEVVRLKVGELPPGMRKQEHPSPTALYQRELKRRKREGTFVPRRPGPSRRSRRPATDDGSQSTS